MQKLNVDGEEEHRNLLGGTSCLTGKRYSIHHHLLEGTFETATAPELIQKLLSNTPAGWWWWCIESTCLPTSGSPPDLLEVVLLVLRLRERVGRHRHAPCGNDQNVTPTQLQMGGGSN